MAYINKKGGIELTEEDRDALRNGTREKSERWAEEIINYLLWGERSQTK